MTGLDQPIDEDQLKAVLERHMEAVLDMLPRWEIWLNPALDSASDLVIAREVPPIAISEALEDVANVALRIGAAIMTARRERGIPLPPGPGDLRDW